LGDVEAWRRRHRECSSADAHLGLELPHEHGSAGPRFAGQEDDPWLTRKGFVEPSGQRREFLNSARQTVDRERAAKRLMVMERRRSCPIASLSLDALERASRRGDDPFICIAMFRRRRSSQREGELPKPIAKRMNTDGGADPLPNRTAVLGVRSREDHYQAVFRTTDMIVGSKGMPEDL
jgi:alkanesulfonate monooxygenase SsuD/methylene tetrahydromethanopterin reductase-like flavin-dependent oxidoreductase (luciferase family)